MHRQQSTRARGMSGRRFGPARRVVSQPQPVKEGGEQSEQPQPQQIDDRREPSSSRQPQRQQRPDFKTTKKANPDLTPKHVSTNFTPEKNDPLLGEYAVPSETFREVYQPRDFQVDYSGLLVLLDSSYTAQTTADRELGKYVSRSMWNYYHVVLLWRKLLIVKSKRGISISDRDALCTLIGEDFPCSTEITAYLNGLGDIIDQDGARARLMVQGRLLATMFYGAAGAFGRVTAATHVIYETLPSPLVALLRIRADLAFTDAGGPLEWDLPADLQPANAGHGLPTAQLLGWRPSERLTDTQRSTIRAAGFTLDNFNVDNPGNVPVNELLMQSIAGYIRSSKIQCYKLPSMSGIGSIAQVPFSEKILTAEDFVDPAPDEAAPIEVDPLSLLAGKLMRTSTCKQFTIHIASIASTFRYRIKRLVRSPEDYLNRDMLAYRFQAVPPNAWIQNANAVYEYGVGAQWNRRVFSLPDVSGAAMATRYCEALRKNITRG